MTLSGKYGYPSFPESFIPKHKESSIGDITMSLSSDIHGANGK